MSSRFRSRPTQYVPQALELAQNRRGTIVIVYQCAFGNLQLEPGRRQPRVGQYLLDEPGEVPLAELNRRQVDGQLYRLGP
jgi:hypothetical protein